MIGKSRLLKKSRELRCAVQIVTRCASIRATPIKIQTGVIFAIGWRLISATSAISAISERRNDAIADIKPRNTCAARDHIPGQLMTEHCGARDVRSTGNICMAYTRCPNFDNQFAGIRCGKGEVTKLTIVTAGFSKNSRNDMLCLVRQWRKPSSSRDNCRPLGAHYPGPSRTVSRRQWAGLHHTWNDC